MSETTEATQEQAASDDAAQSGKAQQDEEIDIFKVAEGATVQKDANGKAIRPDYIAEQFWDAEKGEPRLEAMGRSWLDLRKQVSKGTGKTAPPPEKDTDYTLPAIEDLPEGAIGGKDDTLWPEIRAAAHKAGVTQEQLSAIATPYLKQVAAQLKERATETDPAAAKARQIEEMRAELAKLGPSGRELALDARGWIDGLQGRGIFTAEEAHQIKALGTAVGVRALLKLRDLTGEKPIPIDALDAEGGTVEDYRKMLTEGYATNNKDLQTKARAGLERLEKSGALKVA